MDQEVIEKGTEWSIGERFRGWRLDRFLAEQIPKLSRNRIQQLIGERIRLSWRKRVSPGVRVQVGGRIFAGFPELHEKPIDLPFSLLFENEHFFAIDKPAGIVVHPTNQCRANSLIEILKRQRPNETPILVHRLDRETSGLLLVAKNTETARAFGKAFMKKTLRKTYIARVYGKPPSESGIISTPIGKDPKRKVYVRRIASPQGEAALTNYRLIRREKETSLLEFTPITGRTHQLRVHAESIGCPIVGDPLYGHPDEHYLAYVRGEATYERLHLHAWKISGRWGDEAIAIESPLPEWFGAIS